MAPEPALASPRRRPGPLRLALLEPNFTPYLIGTLLSTCGTWFQNIAQTLLVYRLTGSVFLVGVVNAAQFLGVFVVGPWAGVAADRWDRRRLLLGTQSVAAAITLILAAASAADQASIPLIVVVALALGLAQAFSVPAMLSLVPQLVPDDCVGAAVALNVATFNTARAIGPVLGAVVVSAFGVSAAFAINALSFVALACALMVVKPSERPGRPDRRRARLRDTVRSVAARSSIARVFVVATAASFAVDPVTTLSPEFATEIFERSDTLVGWIVGVFGCGAVVAALFVSGRPLASDRGLGRTALALVVSMGAFAVSSALWFALVAMFAAGCSFIALTTASLTRIQRTTPADEHGRLMALWAISFMGSRPIAGIVDGALATPFGVRVTTLLVIIPVAWAGGWLAVRGDATTPQPSQ
ncbi:MAG: MFS transporter [Ilumatobacteraceae bacterium]|nr:MFS transporter [Ilumatobacteraceae bacterium]